MIITILILALLVWAFLIGYSRGLALQGFYTVGSIVAIMIASAGYQALGKKITLWVPFSSATPDSKLAFYPAKLLFEIDHVFYAALAFLMIYALTYAIVRVIGIFLTTLDSMIILDKKGNIIAGFLSVCSVYFGVSLVMMTLSTIPVITVQDHLYASGLVRFMIGQTPIFSGWLKDIFISKITQITV
ncbi:CvpA family protein [Lactococcus insecticola]|uniref:Colicin V production protein n=1 Tax=Pseudolactococcus insecticola TaxID=2709158 RepID=A0A6A0B457_9LACT|nr:CvpA family protein [Lactococcus insecticola]GFH40129.1 colicin V production protein [Lactococcus insecticola]